MRSFTSSLAFAFMLSMLNFTLSACGTDDGAPTEGESEAEAEGEGEGECITAGDCDNGTCAVNGMCAECTREVAQGQAEYCSDPANYDAENLSYCPRSTDLCAPSPGGNDLAACPCCPSTDPLGCIYFWGGYLYDSANQPVTGDIQFRLGENSPESVLIPYIMVDVPAGIYNYTIQKKGYEDYRVISKEARMLAAIT
mgnify:CR=1 FL=1